MTEKPKTRSVEIDFEIHQMIELEKRGFDESDNDALARAYGLVSHYMANLDVLKLPARKQSPPVYNSGTYVEAAY